MLVLRHPAAAFDSRHLLYYVGVHHKTGTVWMNRLHQSIAWRLGLPLIRLYTPPDPSASMDFSVRVVDPDLLDSTLQSMRAQRRGIVFDRHSLFGEVPKQIPRMRGLHLVRDPRDVLISATFYHLKSHEAWLHRPRPQFESMTYQEKLRSVGTVREALLFELRHLTGVVIKEMAAFPKLANVATITYESLMVGDVPAAFESIFATLGFSRRAQRVALAWARRRSIVLNPKPRRSPHVRSGRPHQWRQEFDQDLGEQFVAETGDELVALGYEPDDSWLNELPATRPALDEALPVRESEAGFDGDLGTRARPGERTSSPDAGTEAVSR